MVHSKSKEPQRRAISVFVLTTVVVLFAAIVISRAGPSESPQAVSDPIILKKALILAIVSSGKPLTPEDRDTLFLSLSGPRMLQYDFTGSEKQMIVKALNAANSLRETTQKDSSLKEGLSSAPISRIFKTTEAYQ